MKRKFLLHFFLLLSMISFAGFLFSQKSHAIENPLDNANNSMGVHILFPDEIEQAAKLVNGNGGEWGYVTIPIQIGDRDLETWQKFMDDAKRLKIIPLIRLATEPKPLDTAVWRKPTDYDVIDFANFLNSLSWPTQNRYVIIFNEVNHAAEWGGEVPNPSEYGEIVKYAHEAFKSRSSSFYLILGGMDVEAPDDFVKHINGYTYLELLISDPEVLNSIDAFSSHSYPNPAFSAPPLENRKNNIASYRYEYELLNRNRDKKLPIFITETGWSDTNLPGTVISEYYEHTLQNIWGKDSDKIVAITPFLLNSAGGPFDSFSFLKNGEEKVYYKTLASIKKTQGKPTLDTEPKQKQAPFDSQVFAALTFQDKITLNEKEESPFVKLYFKTILGLN